VRHFLRIACASLLLAVVGCGMPTRAQAQQDNDHTLQAMRDEMARAKSRLELKIPGTDQPVRPYYLEYRLLDLEVRQVVAQFGTILSSTRTRNRFMDVEARVGSYKLDSSNFVSDDGFRGFIGPTGSVGIDRDYDSLRQDLWIATDQPSRKRWKRTHGNKPTSAAWLASPTLMIFRKSSRCNSSSPLVTPDWTSRNWDQEARDTSAALRAFPQIYESRVTYYLVYATEYLTTSEGTEIRQNRSYAAIEAGLNALADDGVPLNHFYATYARTPADLPNVDAVRKGLNVTGSELMALRAAPTAQDYTGPVLFEARAAAPLLAQVLGPAVNGSRPPVSFTPVMEQMLSGLAGRATGSDASVLAFLPASVSLVDDPGAKDFKGVALLGKYAVDEEGVRAQKVTLVENGTVKNELMSRRPGRTPISQRPWSRGVPQ